MRQGETGQLGAWPESAADGSFQTTRTELQSSRGMDGLWSYMRVRADLLVVEVEMLEDGTKNACPSLCPPPLRLRVLSIGRQMSTPSSSSSCLRFHCASLLVAFPPPLPFLHSGASLSVSLILFLLLLLLGREVCLSGYIERGEGKRESGGDSFVCCEWYAYTNV